ncbi:MAG: hypothetical protein ACOC1Q_02095, partial [Desulfosalsimonas sp.]
FWFKDRRTANKLAARLFYFVFVYRERNRITEMAAVNYRKNEIQLKIVYYGPGRSGKTTCLEHIRKKLDRRGDAELLR